jgi:hypothetical protein
MNQTPFLSSFIFVLLPLLLLEVVLKALSLWKAARKSQKGWFIALLFLNTVGILPLIYLLFVADKESKKK